ncbi:MAG: tetratricopeptide repeat protein [Candidatus Hydrogenedentota bacterium]
MKRYLLLIIMFIAISSLNANNNILLYLNKAEEAFTNKEYSLAIEYYKRILEIRPFTKEAYNGLGRIYAALNRDDEALLEFNKAIKIDPNYIECLNNIAWLYIEREEYDTSLAYIKEVLTRQPTNPAALINNSFILLKNNKKREAKVLLEDIIKEHPQFGEPYSYLAEIISEDRRDIWLQSLKKEWVDKPRLELSLKKMESKIREYYESAIKFSRDPSYPSIKYGLFLNELAEENLSQAMVSISKSLKKEALNKLSLVKDKTDNINVLLLISYLENEEGDDTNALATIDKVLSLNPTHTIALYNKSLILHKKGDIALAINNLLELKKIDPEDEISLFSVEKLLIKNRPVDDRERITLSGEHIEKAKGYFNAKEGMLSLVHFRKAVKLTPQNPNARKELATYYYKNQIFKQANFHVNKLLELDPFNRDAKDLEEFLKRDEQLLRERSGLITEPEPIEQPQLPILVLNFYTENPSVNHWDGGEILSLMLRNRISFLDGYKVIDVSSLQIDQQIKESQIELEAIIEELTLKLGARLVIWGNFREDEKRASAVYNIMDITSRKKIEYEVAASQGEGRIDKVLDSIIKTLRETLSPPGKIYKIEKNFALVNLGRLHNVKKGDILYVFRDIDKGIPHIDIRSTGEKHTRLRFLGYVKVTGALENYSIGEMIPWYETREKMQLNDEVFLYGTLFPLDEDIRFRESQKEIVEVR